MGQQKYGNVKYKGIKRIPSRLSLIAKDIGQWKVRTLYTIIVICLLALVFLYILYLSLDTEEVIKNNRGYGYKGNAVHDQMPDNEIMNILSMIYDTRPSHCKNTVYNLENIKPASIILHYNEDEFYSMKLTLQSLIRNTPSELYEEIILFDDGSTRKPIAIHALKFLKRAEFHKVRTYRSENIGGPSASRYKASKLAKSEILIFIDTKAIVNVGWIEPLLSGINTYPRSIISSHNDVLRIHGVNGKDSKFLPSPNNYLPINTWSLSVVYLEGSETKAAYRSIPSMKGDTFAVQKQFLTDIGDYDDTLDMGNGHNLELGLRAWLCGNNADGEDEDVDMEMKISPANARLKMAVCSRVAVKDDLKPRAVGTKKNARRIIELWYGNYKHFAYKQSETSNNELSLAEKQSLKERRQALGNLKMCRDMHWYLKHVAGDTLVPTDKILHFGQLRGLKTALTFRIEYSSGDEQVTLGLTSSAVYLYDSQRIFELTTQGHLRSAQKGCVAAIGKRANDIPLTIEKCELTSNGQIWSMSEEGIITNKQYPNMCLKSTTDYNRKHIPRLSNCDNNDPNQYWKFMKF